MIYMVKKNLLVLLVAALWLAEGLFCFCSMEKAVFSFCQSDGCADESAPSVPESGTDDCGPCCGHLVFISGNFVSIQHHFIQEEFSLQSLVFSDQSSFRSIDPPPKA